MAASTNAAIDPSLNQNQAVALPDSEPLYRITRISTEEGLSSSDIGGVARDGQGFMWFGTVDGLNRYDGYQMKVFKNLRADPTSLSDNLIRTLYTDRAGTLWVGTWFGGLNRYERKTETFTRFQHDPADPTSVSSNSVFAILEDGAGNLWLGTRGGGLNRFDAATGVFTHFRHDPGDPASLGNDNVFALAKDADGTLWLSTDGGLDHFDPATGSFRHYRHGKPLSGKPGRPGQFKCKRDLGSCPKPRRQALAGHLWQRPGRI
jgi:ligand-binding sensor domain-containing protein